MILTFLRFLLNVLMFISQVIFCVVFNQLVVGLPVAYLSYHLMMWRGSQPLRELPTFHWVLAELALFIIIEEISFYYSHRYVAFVLISCVEKLLTLFEIMDFDGYFLWFWFRFSCGTYL